MHDPKDKPGMREYTSCSVPEQKAPPFEIIRTQGVAGSQRRNPLGVERVLSAPTLLSGPGSGFNGLPSFMPLTLL